MKTNFTYFKRIIQKIASVILLAFGFLTFAQITIDGTTGDYTTNVDNILTYVDKSPITTGILYDRVMSFADLDILKEDGNITNSNYQHFMQSWSELYRASYSPSFLSLENLKSNLIDNSGEISTNMTTKLAIANPNTPIDLSNTVYIGIINTKMNYIDFGTPSQQSLAYSNGYLYNKPGINPILEKQVTVISPLKEKITTTTVTFRLSPTYMMQLTGSPIKNLVANFGTGLTYSLITNGVNTTTFPSITFSSSGKKTFIFNVTYNDNTTETLKATLEVQLSAPPVEYNRIVTGIYPEAEDFVGTSGITQTIAFKGYNETTSTSGKLEYRTYYNTVSNPGFDSSNRKFSIQPKLRKEIIILDGYDPGDTRKIYDQSSGYDSEHSSLYELMQYDPDDNLQTDNNKNLVRVLQEKGYDVTLVNFQNGADYIERNAMALVALLQRENAKLAANGSTEQIAIIGPSMGGLVSRYALAYMEKNNIPHNTRLWVSFDSPHLGANIPMAAQETLYFFGYKANQEVAKTKFDENFRSPAARQMLIEQIDYVHQNPPYSTDLLPNGTVPSGQNNNTPFRYKFLNNLNNNGISGSSGFPQNLRKIAVINGNTSGVKTNSESQLHLELAAFKIVKYGQIFGTSIQTKINVARIQERFLSTPNNAVQTFYGKSTSFGFLYVNFLYHTVNRTNVNPRGSMDIVPGGIYNTQGIIKNEFDSALNEAIPGRRSIEWRTYVPNHAFIPTVSSLAFKNPNFDWSTPLDRNLICDTYNKEIPFDSYFAPKTSQGHVFVSGEMVDWLTKELDGNPQTPHFSINASTFLGTDQICTGDSTTFAFSEPCKLPTVPNWSVSANLQIISSNDSSVTVKSLYQGQGTVTATFQNGQTFSKNLHMGGPNIKIPDSVCDNPYDTVCFSSDHYLALNQANCVVVDGVGGMKNQSDWTDYEWEKVMGNFTFLSSGNCGVANATNNGTKALGKVAIIYPTSAGDIEIKVRAKNNCGWGPWKYVFFTKTVGKAAVSENDLFKISPNPSDDIINISLINNNNIPINQSIVNVELYNSLGIKQKSSKLNSNKGYISVTGLIQGVYILKIIYDNKIETHQIIVK